MQNLKFEDGQKLAAIFFPDGSNHTVGVSTCDEIIVVVEDAGVWFAVIHNEAIMSKFNSEYVEGVGYLEAD